MNLLLLLILIAWFPISLIIIHGLYDLMKMEENFKDYWYNDSMQWTNRYFDECSRNRKILEEMSKKKNEE